MIMRLGHEPEVGSEIAFGNLRAFPFLLPYFPAGIEVYIYKLGLCIVVRHHYYLSSMTQLI